MYCNIAVESHQYSTASTLDFSPCNMNLTSLTATTAAASSNLGMVTSFIGATLDLPKTNEQWTSWLVDTMHRYVTAPYPTLWSGIWMSIGLQHREMAISCKEGSCDNQVSQSARKRSGSGSSQLRFLQFSTCRWRFMGSMNGWMRPRGSYTWIIMESN